MEYTIGDILKATGGRLLQGSAGRTVSGLSTDTRTLKAGDLFVAIKGTRHDGHGFIADATAGGASGALVDQEELDLPASINVIVVRDTLNALSDMASYARSVRPVPLVAVAGSSGKTTTKEMIAAILSDSRCVLKTEGNRNNLIGLPLTLFGLSSIHDVVVVELGVNTPGEMQRLTVMCRPDVAVITNIGRSHLEGFGDIEGVAREKVSLFNSLGPGAVMIVNADDARIAAAARSDAYDKMEKITFGTGEGVDVRVKGSKRLAPSALEVSYDVRGKAIEVRFSNPLECNAINGAAAIAAALALGVGVYAMRDPLEAFTTPEGRLEVRTISGAVVLDDTYNSNPDSAAAALETLGGYEGRKIAVLGDMLEMGECSDQLHREVGRLAAETGVEVLLITGLWKESVKAGAISGGMDEPSIRCFYDTAAIVDELKSILRPGDSVLVKGSRQTRMDEVISGLEDD